MKTTSPLYATIPYFGNEFTVTYAADVRPSAHTTMTRSGYGDLPQDLPADLPVIDFRNCENVCKAINIPDNDRPREANPHYTGTIVSYLAALRACGIRITTVTDCQHG